MIQDTLIAQQMYKHNQTIQSIQNTLKSHFQDSSDYGANYLKNKCMETTRLTNLIIPTLSQKAGYVNGQWHAWNYDLENNLIVDLSIWQFPKFDKNIYLFDEKSKFHKLSKKATWKQNATFTLNPSNVNQTIEDLLEVYNYLK